MNESVQIVLAAHEDGPFAGTRHVRERETPVRDRGRELEAEAVAGGHEVRRGLLHGDDERRVTGSHQMCGGLKREDGLSRPAASHDKSGAPGREAAVGEHVEAGDAGCDSFDVWHGQWRRSDGLERGDTLIQFAHLSHETGK